MNSAFIIASDGTPHVFSHRNFDNVYRDYLKFCLINGEDFPSEKGPTKRIVYGSITADCREHFPLTTLRKINWNKVYDEFKFDIGFSGNVDDLGSARNFWAHLADENGELGATCYNRQWRRWPAYAKSSQIANESLHTQGEFDQFKKIREQILLNPHDRAMVAITMNPAVSSTKCVPCHIAMIFSSDGKFLDVQVPSRSNDLILGFPIDMARYALILHMIAKEADLSPRYVHIPHSNAHIYEVNYEVAHEMIVRSPASRPTLHGDRICNYIPNPGIKITFAR